MIIDPTSLIEEPCDIGDGARIMGQAIIKKHSRIGAGSVIEPGVTVGQYARVGDDSVVNVDVPDHGYVVGNPAILYGYVCECGSRLGFFYSMGLCPSCGLRYQQINNAVFRAPTFSVS